MTCEIGVADGQRDGIEDVLIAEFGRLFGSTR